MPQAPRYNWVCFSCQTVNPAGEAWCSNCSGPASVSGAKITSAHSPAQVSKPPVVNSPERPASFFIFLLVGFYLLAGAYVAISQKKWPVFMPPQLDCLALLSSVFGEVASAYVAGGISGLLGIFCLIGSAYALHSEIRPISRSDSLRSPHTSTLEDTNV